MRDYGRVCFWGTTDTLYIRQRLCWNDIKTCLCKIFWDWEGCSLISFVFVCFPALLAASASPLVAPMTLVCVYVFLSRHANMFAYKCVFSLYLVFNMYVCHTDLSDTICVLSLNILVVNSKHFKGSHLLALRSPELSVNLLPIDYTPATSWFSIFKTILDVQTCRLLSIVPSASWCWDEHFVFNFFLQRNSVTKSELSEQRVRGLTSKCGHGHCWICVGRLYPHWHRGQEPMARRWYFSQMGFNTFQCPAILYTIL